MYLPRYRRDLVSGRYPEVHAVDNQIEFPHLVKTGKYIHYTHIPTYSY